MAHADGILLRRTRSFPKDHDAPPVKLAMAVSKVAPVDKLSVALAIVLGILFVGETLTWPVALGGALIVAGSVVIIAF